MSSRNTKVVVGFITYGNNTAPYLSYFCPSLKRQSFSDFEVMVCDNTPEPENSNVKYLQKEYPSWEVVSRGRNLGFAGAYNILISKAVAKGAQYFLALNPDMVLEPDSLEELIRIMEEDENLGSASPKILKWDFANDQKTSVIDTCGIKIKKNLTFFDLGQGEADKGQYDNAEILGPSGAAAIYRVSALREVKEGGNYFDEMMFMYKEDCDLAYRMSLTGYRSLCAGGSVLYHDRTASGQGETNFKIALNRTKKGRPVKKWSFFNQQVIFIKYWGIQTPARKAAILWYQLRCLIFILLFEQYLLKEYWRIFKARKDIIKY